MTEAVIIANQWTGFYMIKASIMKELRILFLIITLFSRHVRAQSNNRNIRTTNCETDSKHGHKKHSLETRAVLIEIFMLC